MKGNLLVLFVWTYIEGQTILHVSQHFMTLHGCLLDKIYDLGKALMRVLEWNRIQSSHANSTIESELNLRFLFVIHLYSTSKNTINRKNYQLMIDIEQSWLKLASGWWAGCSNYGHHTTGSCIGEPGRCPIYMLLSHFSTLCKLISFSHQTHEHERKAHWGEQSQLCQFTSLGGFRESGRCLILFATVKTFEISAFENINDRYSQAWFQWTNVH